MARPRLQDMPCSVPGCGSPGAEWIGDVLCKLHAYRVRRHGDPNVALRDMSLRSAPGTPTPERIAAKLASTTGVEMIWTCWEWQGFTQKGYGRVPRGVPEVPGETLAHRIVYTLVRGPIPAGLTLDHLCRNPPCCNPFHLEPVTQRVNTLRGESPHAANARKTHCANGHPLSGENLRVEANGARRCKSCAADANRRHLTRKNGTAVYPPVVTISGKNLTLSQAAHETLGSPAAVRLSLDGTLLTIIADPDGQAVRPPGHSTAFRSFATRHRIDTSPRRWVPAVEGQRLVVDLADPGEPTRQGPLVRRV